MDHPIAFYAKRKKRVSAEKEEWDTEIERWMQSRSKRRHFRAAAVDHCNKKWKRKSRKKNTPAYMYVLDNDGTFRLGTPFDSLWWVNYVLLPPTLLTNRQRMKFRKRYRMPYDTWRDFVDELNKSEIMKTWHRGNVDATKTKMCSPIELLSLGALKYLGRKCTFDDIEETTFISERTHERFFKKFIEFGSKTFYPKHVVMPNKADQIRMQLEMMAASGFPGCCTSSDATHIPLERCRFGLKQAHKGWKLDTPARTYNLCVTHTRRILSSTGGHPARWNDQTLAWFDDFLMKLKNGKVMSDYVFELYEYDEMSRIVSVKYCGVWALVDNGYHDWPTTIPPFKFCSNVAMVRWSQWIESIRKDVECTIGILKKRWSILKKGVQGQNIEDADKVWLTCCALHNFLLDIDGYDKMWEHDSMDEGGDHNDSNFALNRLQNPDLSAHPLQYRNSSSMRQNNNVLQNVGTSGGIRKIWKMDFDEFRMKLVEHFDIMFQKHNIIWSKGIRVLPRSV